MSDRLNLNKKETRQTILQQRKAFPAKEKNLAEQRMLKFLKNWDVFIQAETIHLFMSKIDEPNTGPIILYAWESGKTIVVPYVLPNTFNLFHSQLNSFDDLSPGALGVLEPSPGKRIRITPESINLVIIPGVAFDLQGGRIGYGKGYYDRFLEQTKAFRLALAFDFQIIDKVPTEKHDVPMNGILSESGIFEVNN